MPSAKVLFLDRMSAFQRSVLDAAVTNRALNERAHNDVARMFRNGLAVVGFAALEDFIKSTTSEILEELGTFGIPFSDLPAKLQQACTYEALDALSFQSQFMSQPDKIAYIQEHAARIASTATTPWELTTHALGYSQSNLNDKSVKEILKCFSVTDPWRQMTRIGARLNLISLPLNETFQNAARRRHRAAHTPLADTPQSDLQQYVKEALATAIAFDGLLRRALTLLRNRDATAMEHGIDGYGDIVQIRTVSFTGGKWKEQIQGRQTAVRAGLNEQRLSSDAHSRAMRSKDMFVTFDDQGYVRSWDAF